jgi:hypothetical protein
VWFSTVEASFVIEVHTSLILYEQLQVREVFAIDIAGSAGELEISRDSGAIVLDIASSIARARI